MKIILPFSIMMLYPLSNKSLVMLFSVLFITFIMICPLYPLPMFWNPILYSDKISFILIILTMMSFLLISVSSSSYLNILLLMSSINITLIITFLSSSTLMFYILFETVLIPTLVLIIKKGNSPERIQAGIYLLMYTIFGSLPLLLGLLWYSDISSLFFITLMSPKFNMPLIFMVAFLVKLPMYFFHLWLPKAHVEAPLEGSMILAAVLLKLGGYGLIRLSPSIQFMPSIMKSSLLSLSLMGAVFTSVMCMRQKDLKSLIAYSSIGHMSLVLAAIISFKSIGLSAAIMMMMAHGLSSSSLFFLITLIYSNNHTRNILSFKGLLMLLPNLTFWFFMFTAINISAPPSLNMLSEINIFSSLIQMDYINMFMIMMAAMAVASFSIMLYSNITHNLTSTPNTLSPPPSKTYLSLFIHLIPLIIVTTKPEIMSP